MEQNLLWIENEILKVGISLHGAEVCSVTDKMTGRDMIWCGDRAVFGGHSPVLFPWTGRLTEDSFEAKGRRYPGSYHGFLKDQEHELSVKGNTFLRLKLQSNEDMYRLWPYSFTVYSDFMLEANTLHHVITVLNDSGEKISFGLGFHPAFAIPFDKEHAADDYRILFEKPESPLCVDTSAEGLVSGKLYYLERNVQEIMITDHLFDSGSHCMTNLRSKKICLAEKNSDRRIEVSLDGFPYVLLWSSNVRPVRFVCIEPWMSLPGEDGGAQSWDEKPAAAVLAPKESWRCELRTTYYMDTVL